MLLSPFVIIGFNERSSKLWAANNSLSKYFHVELAESLLRNIPVA